MHVELYTKPNCTYCSMTKAILQTNGISFKESMLDRDFTREWIKETYPTAITYPIIVVDGYYIGGYTQFKAIIEEKTSDTKKLLTE